MYICTLEDILQWTIPNAEQYATFDEEVAAPDDRPKCHEARNQYHSQT